MMITFTCETYETFSERFVINANTNKMTYTETLTRLNNRFKIYGFDFINIEIDGKKVDFEFGYNVKDETKKHLMK